MRALFCSGLSLFRLDNRTNLSDIVLMRPAELLRRLRRLATKRGWDLEVWEGGSHTRVILNRRDTTVPRHATDLPKGTFRAILKQLGLTQHDLEI
jgi:mRNA interferase HicA